MDAMTGTSSSSSSSSKPPPSFASFIFLDDASRRLAAAERIKFVCSYGGKILPRRPDGKLRYVGGHTRVVSVRRSVSFSELETKLRELSRCGGAALSLRCQLPTLDLDALVSVTSDDDLLNLINEYAAAADRDVHNPLRIRAFLLFPPSRPPSPSSPSAATTTSSFSSFSSSPDYASPSTSPPRPAGRELRSSSLPPRFPGPRVRRQSAPASPMVSGQKENPAAAFFDPLSSPMVSRWQKPAGGGFARDRRLQADRQNHHHYGLGTSRSCSFHPHH